MRFGILSLLALGQCAPAQTSTTCNNTPAYSPCELVFDLSPQDAAAHPNPYASVELRAEVRSPRNRTTAVPGYWDGGRRMVIRFAPTEGGQWAFRLTSNVAALNDQTGTFTATDSDAPGFIKAANMHHWSYTERLKPHLWMGATELRFAFLDDAAFRANSERAVGQVLASLFEANPEKRIIVACFASHIHRVQQVADAASGLRALHRHAGAVHGPERGLCPRARPAAYPRGTAS